MISATRACVAGPSGINDVMTFGGDQPQMLLCAEPVCGFESVDPSCFLNITNGELHDSPCAPQPCELPQTIEGSLSALPIVPQEDSDVSNMTSSLSKRRAGLPVGALVSPAPLLTVTECNESEEPVAVSPVVSGRRRDKMTLAVSAIKEVDDECDESTDAADLEQLKKYTERLNLDTRRPSFNDWVSRWNKLKESKQGAQEGEEGRPELDISSALQWIREELLAMRVQDAQLARQLMSLRTEIQKIKLQRSQCEHQILLEDVTLEIEALEELAELCDTPCTLQHTRLHGLGVTRMNISSRRFSCI